MPGRPAILKIDILSDAGPTTQALGKTEKAIDKLGDTATDAGKKVGTASKRLNNIGEASSKSGALARKTGLAFADLGSALAGLPGPLGSIGSGMQAIQGPARALSGAGELLNIGLSKLGMTSAATAIKTGALTVAQQAQASGAKASAIAQGLFNAVMNANPIVLVVTALGALAAAFVVAWNKSETFRNVVKGVFGAIKTSGQDVADSFTHTIPDALRTAVNLSMIPWNALARAWNSTIGKISFHIPSWVPGLGGKGFSMPDLPTVNLAASPTLLGGATPALHYRGYTEVHVHIDGRELRSTIRTEVDNRLSAAGRRFAGGLV